MVAQLLRLRLRLLLNSVRRPVGALVGRAIAIVVSILAIVWATDALTSSVADDANFARSLFVVVFAVVGVAFFMVPLLFTREDPLDPRRLALFGLSARGLAGGVALAGLVAVPIVMLLAASLASLVVWSGHSEAVVGTVLLGLLGILVGIAIFALLTRIASALAALLLDSQRARSLGGSLGILLLVVAAPVIALLASQDWKNDADLVLGELAATAGWTPFGAPWAVLSDAATGNWTAGILHLLLALGYVGAFWLIWWLLVARMLVTPGRAESQRSARGLGWFDRLPHGPTGAIAARSFTYWMRDPRYWVSVAIIPVAPLLVVIPLLIAGVPGNGLVLLPVPFMCLFIGWAVHNDVAYDGSAIWMHIASGVSGLADRVGRIIPILVGGVFVIGAGSALSVYFYGDWDVLPSVLGASTALLLCGLGCASFTSTRFPYAAPTPGDGAFTQPQSSAGSSTAVQALSLLVTLLLASPTIVLAVLGLTGEVERHQLALVTGVGSGLLVLVLGIWWGSRVFARRGPEMLASALRS